jgi:hypothetical protein
MKIMAHIIPMTTKADTTPAIMAVLFPFDAGCSATPAPFPAPTPAPPVANGPIPPDAVGGRRPRSVALPRDDAG